ncbi:hypothetical protein CF067_20460 [Clostridium sporogenes]
MLERANKSKVLYVNKYSTLLLFNRGMLYLLYIQNIKILNEKEKYKNELNTVIKELKRLDFQLSNFIN